MWLWNLCFSAAFAVCGGIGAYFGWLGRRGAPRRSYDFAECVELSLVAFVLFFLVLTVGGRRKGRS